MKGSELLGQLQAQHIFVCPGVIIVEIESMHYWSAEEMSLSCMINACSGRTGRIWLCFCVCGRSFGSIRSLSITTGSTHCNHYDKLYDFFAAVCQTSMANALPCTRHTCAGTDNVVLSAAYCQGLCGAYCHFAHGHEERRLR